MTQVECHTFKICLLMHRWYIKTTQRSEEQLFHECSPTNSLRTGIRLFTLCFKQHTSKINSKYLVKHINLAPTFCLNSEASVLFLINISNATWYIMRRTHILQYPIQVNGFVSKTAAICLDLNVLISCKGYITYSRQFQVKHAVSNGLLVPVNWLELDFHSIHLCSWLWWLTTWCSG